MITIYMTCVLRFLGCLPQTFTVIPIFTSDDLHFFARACTILFFSPVSSFRFVGSIFISGCQKSRELVDRADVFKILSAGSHALSLKWNKCICDWIFFFQFYQLFSNN